jgi:hypothetical protein
MKQLFCNVLTVSENCLVASDIRVGASEVNAQKHPHKTHSVSPPAYPQYPPTYSHAPSPTFLRCLFPPVVGRVHYLAHFITKNIKRVHPNEVLFSPPFPSEPFRFNNLPLLHSAQKKKQPPHLPHKCSRAAFATPPPNFVSLVLCDYLVCY